MTDLRTAAQQALKALEFFKDTAICSADTEAASETITALRAALAEYDKDRVRIEERKAKWAEQLQLARETQERDRQQREYEEQRLAALAEPVQGPVAWMVYALDGQSVCVTDNPEDFTPQHRALPLYTAPPQRKPLTDEEIYAAIKGIDSLKAVEVARAIEKAHGIE